MRFQAIHSADELAALVKTIGFLPFFKNEIPGFSVEECTPRKYWFAGEVDGPWEWKGPVIKRAACAYGKLFRGKAGFIAKRWSPDFANYLREGYDFDERYAKGLVAHQDKLVYEALRSRDSVLSTELKRLCGFSGKGRGGFDGIMARLQEQGYVVVVDFEYRRDKYGSPYGWGIARYAIPERRFGMAFMEGVRSRTPEQSLEKILKHLSRLLPDASERQIASLIG